MDEHKLRSRVLVSIASVLLIFSSVSFWLSENVYNTTKFNSLLTSAFEEQSSRDAISSQIVDTALKDYPLVKQVAGDTLQSSLSGLLGNASQRPVMEQVSTAFHDYLLNPNKTDITIGTGKYAAVARSIVSAIAPDAKNILPDSMQNGVVLIKASDLPNIAPYLQAIVVTGPIAGLVAIALLIYLLIVSTNRPKELKRIGMFLGITSVVALLAVPYFGIVINSLSTNQNLNTLLQNIYHTFAETFTRQTVLILFASIALYVGTMIYEKYDKKNKETK